MKKDLQRDVIRFSIPLLTMKSCEKKTIRKISAKKQPIFLSLSIAVKTYYSTPSANNLISPSCRVTNAVSGLPKIENCGYNFASTFSQQHHINTSKDSPKQANILHSIPYNNIAGNLTWPPGPFNITTAKCSISISEVGSKG